MAPVRTKDESDDPVTASYDIYLTPQQSSSIYLLQYPNRLRDRPYSARHGSQPRALRLKPKTGHLEVDIPLNTEHNFNKYAGLKWGGALKTAQETQNSSSTFGLAGGLAGPKGGAATAARGLGPKDSEAERDAEITNRLQRFSNAERDGQVMDVQTLGGQVVRHTGTGEEDGKPWYFVGAFKGSELHLTRVEGTAQMRPQFHHVDAEAQKETLLKIKGSQAASGEGEPQARTINQRVQQAPSANPKGDLEAREAEMEKALTDAREEGWVGLRYVDEDEDEAYGEWNERMFVADTEGLPRLQSGMDDEDYIDAISAPGRASPTRRRRRRNRKGKEGGEDHGDYEEEGEEGDDEGDAMEGVKRAGR